MDRPWTIRGEKSRLYQGFLAWQKRKCGTQQPKMAAASRVCVLPPLLEYRIRKSLKQPVIP